MSRILQNSARGKLQHTLPLNQKKNPLRLNTISNPAAVTLSPSGISDRFLFTNITFVEIYRKSVIRCCKPLRSIVYYSSGHRNSIKGTGQRIAIYEKQSLKTL